MSQAALFLAQGLAGDEGLLSASEMERLGSIKASLRRSQFLSAHSLLRLALDFYDGSGDQRELKALAGQAPEIPGGPFISLSHSGNLAACLLSPAGPCGVDVEDAERLRDFPALAAHTFEGQAAKKAKDQKGFYEAWCLKEARFKAGNPQGGAGALFAYGKFQGALWLPAQAPLDCYGAGPIKKIVLKIAWL